MIIDHGYTSYTQDGLQVGDTGYLLESENVASGRPSAQRWLQPEPGRTNMSNDPRPDGWLGTTNDISIYALGRAVVTQLLNNGRAVVRRLDDDE